LWVSWLVWLVASVASVIRIKIILSFLVDIKTNFEW
jgi:hypothetical protein